jgi:hypothetical protein
VSRRYRLRYVEPGELHSETLCALCGAATVEIRRAFLVWTHAEGRLCVDSSACERRREIQRRAV